MQMHTLVFNCRGWGLITRRRGDPEFLKRVVIKRGAGNFSPEMMKITKKCMKMKESRQSFEKR